MIKKLFLPIYNIIHIICLPIFLAIFLFRITRSKDTWNSLLQRFGFFMPKKNNNNIIWIHAASVGESMVALNLVKAMSDKRRTSENGKYNFIITTGTLSSASILKQNLPSNAIHQFVPIDNILIVNKFLNHWQPKLAIFVESEFWPCLIHQASKKMKIMLVNARLSDRSYSNWQKRKWLFKLITDHFSKIIVQSKADLIKYHNLGCSDAVNHGNLKFSNKELEVDSKKFVKLSSILKNKKIFVASSTHRIDENITLKIIDKLKNSDLDYYPIVILRHPERAKELCARCEQMGLSYNLRSRGENPDIAKDLYIVDSFGELGLFYKLADISFVGGSFKHGGHNLLEPAYFENVILLGPDMSNFKNIADEMVSSKAALQVRDQEQLEEKIKYFLNYENDAAAQTYAENALKFVDNRRLMMNNYLKEIKKILS